MICKQCGTNVPTTEESVGQTVDCPSCHSQLTVSRDPVICICPECQQNFEIETWKEGETVACPGCAKVITPVNTNKAEQKEVPMVPRFRKPGAAPVVTASPPPAPAAQPMPSSGAMPTFRKNPDPVPTAPAPSTPPPPAAPPKVAFPTLNLKPAAKTAGTGVAPALKLTPARKSAAAPEIELVPAPEPPAEQPSFKQKSATTPAETPESDSSVAQNLNQTLVPVEDLLPEAAEYVRRLSAKARTGVAKKESFLQQYVREHLKQIIRISIFSTAILLVCLIVFFLLSSVCKLSFGLSDQDIAKVTVIAKKGSPEELSKSLSHFTPEDRFKLEEILLKQAIKKKSTAELEHLFSVISPTGHTCLLQTLEPDGQFIAAALKKSNRGFDFTFQDGSTLLEHALETKNTKAFNALLKDGADPNKVFKDGLVPLFHAMNQKKEFLELLKYDANVNVMDWNGNTLLFAAVEKERYDLLPHIIKKQTSFVQTNREGRTYLHICITSKDIPNIMDHLDHILEYPCAINAKDPDGKTALQLVLEQNFSSYRVKILESLMLAGAECNQEFEDAVNGSPFQNAYSKFKKRNKGRRFPAKEEDTVIVFKDPCQIIPPSRNPVWEYVIILFLHIASGFLALNFTKPTASATRNQWINCLVLLGGMLSLIVLLLLHIYIISASGTVKLADRLAGQVHQDQLHIIGADGQELEKVEDPEIIPAYLHLRRLLDLVIRQNIPEVSFDPRSGVYAVSAKDGKNEKKLFEVDFPTGAIMLKLLKGLSGLNAYETVMPQNGGFLISLGKIWKQTLVSTIGVGASEEHASILFAEKTKEVENFDQLKFAISDQRKLQDFMNSNGLLLVTGADGNGKRTFVSFLLERIAEKNGSAIWIGMGREPAGSDLVPRINLDPAAGITIEQHLTAISNYPAIAITMSSEYSLLPQIYSLAANKKIVLLMNKPMNEALEICRHAAPKEFDACLKLAVHPWKVEKLCSCAKTQEVPAELIPAFKMLKEEVKTISVHNGCPACLSKGSTESWVIYETCDASGIPPRPAPTVALLTALQLAKAGILGLADLEKIMKGK